MSVTKHTQTINVVIGLNPVAHTLVVILHPNLLACDQNKEGWTNSRTFVVSGYLSFAHTCFLQITIVLIKKLCPLILVTPNTDNFF